jgi:hypothetical protein
MHTIPGVAHEADSPLTFLLRIVLLALLLLLLSGADLSAQPRCGDNIIEHPEECDEGAGNSDSRPDACRADCRLPWCGDGVTDPGFEEECDDGPGNSDRIPNACRRDCRRAFCGDGVVDERRGEECDDGAEGARNPYDGCWRCERCLVPKDDLAIATDTRLCRGRYRVRDTGAEGVIQVTGEGAFLDCRGAVLVGTGSGTGFLVRADGAILRDCHATGFALGVRLSGEGSALFGCGACDNTRDLVAEQAGHYGFRNYCTSAVGWSEAGSGCSLTCSAWALAKMPSEARETSAGVKPAPGKGSRATARETREAPPAKGMVTPRARSELQLKARRAPSRESEAVCRIAGRITGRMELVARVGVYDPEKSRWVGSQTVSEDGSYSLTLPAGRYRVVPQSGGKLGLRSRPAYHELVCAAGTLMTAGFEILGVEEG